MTLEESRAAHPSNYGRAQPIDRQKRLGIRPGPGMPTSPVGPRPGATILLFPTPGCAGSTPARGQVVAERGTGEREGSTPSTPLCIPECIPGDDQG
jgi:hypothetical protein